MNLLKEIGSAGQAVAPSLPEEVTGSPKEKNDHPRNLAVQALAVGLLGVAGTACTTATEGVPSVREGVPSVRAAPVFHLWKIDLDDSVGAVWKGNKLYVKFNGQERLVFSVPNGKEPSPTATPTRTPSSSPTPKPTRAPTPKPIEAEPETSPTRTPFPTLQETTPQGLPMVITEKNRDLFTKEKQPTVEPSDKRANLHLQWPFQALETARFEAKFAIIDFGMEKKPTQAWGFDLPEGTAVRASVSGKVALISYKKGYVVVITSEFPGGKFQVQYYINADIDVSTAVKTGGIVNPGDVLFKMPDSDKIKKTVNPSIYYKPGDRAFRTPVSMVIISRIMDADNSCVLGRPPILWAVSKGNKIITP